MSKALITGGAGYIGSVLAKTLLNNGHKVTTLDNLSFGHESLIHLIQNENFNFIYGDVRNKNQMKDLIPRYDIIFPLAAIVGMPQCEKDPVDAYLVNRDAIKTLEEIRGKDQMVIYPNTNSGYGATTGEKFCTEESPLNPISIYGRTKCESEKILLNSNKPAISFRLATTFGISPRMRTDVMLNHFVFKAVSDGYLVVFEKDFKRNFVHVQDIADCFSHGLDNFDKMKGQAYNLGIDSANVTKKELCDKIKYYVPKFNVVYQEIGSDIDKRNYIVSNDKLRKAGFEAKVGINQGIQELIKGYNLMFSKEVFRQ